MWKRKLSRRIGYSRFVKILLPVVGIGLCLYPFASNFLAEQNMQEIICSYHKMETDFDVMAIIEIPKINVELPIYQGTDKATLAKGVGHICGSDLPIGGEGTHSLLAGHRGLPNAQLFTRLNELEVGDEFYIHLHETKLAYEVCQISVIKPEDTSGLGAQEGRDLISLITCTPYGINTHRLVVTGERKEDL